jgi:hypothetical protein
MAADLTPLYYVSATAASIVGVLGGARSYYARQRKRWTDEGARAQRNTEALERNTEAAAANTAAIGKLAAKLDSFATEARERLNDHGARLNDHGIRLGRLEDVIEAPMRVRRPHRPADE